MPTFRAFQASREWRDDLTPIARHVPGFAYLYDLYIIAQGGGAAPALYTLEWMGDEEVSDDLDTLERKLYNRAKEEGYLLDTPRLSTPLQAPASEAGCSETLYEPA